MADYEQLLTELIHLPIKSPKAVSSFSAVPYRRIPIAATSGSILHGSHSVFGYTNHHVSERCLRSQLSFYWLCIFTEQPRSPFQKADD
ncbi:hypothetical protein TNCV_3105511 [Trichonephila clavipes]|nr:hypothetical protein TNCV_3105511 [Trichonephila clavipes]